MNQDGSRSARDKIVQNAEIEVSKPIGESISINRYQIMEELGHRRIWAWTHSKPKKSR